MRTSHPMTLIGAAAFLFAASIPVGLAQAPYPNQQIKIICPFPAGSPVSSS